MGGVNFTSLPPQAENSLFFACSDFMRSVRFLQGFLHSAAHSHIPPTAPGNRLAAKNHTNSHYQYQKQDESQGSAASESPPPPQVKERKILWLKCLQKLASGRNGNDLNDHCGNTWINGGFYIFLEMAMKAHSKRYKAP